MEMGGEGGESAANPVYNDAAEPVEDDEPKVTKGKRLTDEEMKLALSLIHI